VKVSFGPIAAPAMEQTMAAIKGRGDVGANVIS